MYERIMFTLHLAGFFGVFGTILTLGAQLQWSKDGDLADYNSAVKRHRELAMSTRR